MDDLPSVKPHDIAQMVQSNPTNSLQSMISKMKMNQVLSVADEEGTETTTTTTTTTEAAPFIIMRDQDQAARECFIGNLPPKMPALQLQQFLGTIIDQVGLSLSPGNPILSTWISRDGAYAYLELRSAEECNLALMLHGLNLLGKPLVLGRPLGYALGVKHQPSVGPRTATALTNLGCVPNSRYFQDSGNHQTQTRSSGLDIGRDFAPLAHASALASIDMPTERTTRHTLLMLNISPVFSSAQLTEILSPFGQVKFFELLKNPVGQSAGAGIFEFIDPTLAPSVISGLDGLDLGGQVIRVSFADPEAPTTNNVIPASLSKSSEVPSSSSLLDDDVPQNDDDVPQNTAVVIDSSSSSSDRGSPVAHHPTLATENSPANSQVICLSNMVTVEELEDEEEYLDLKLDIEEECTKYGTLVQVCIPRPDSTGATTVTGLGRAFVVFDSEAGAAKAIKALNGRAFGGQTVHAAYYSLAKFKLAEFDD